MIDSYLPDGTDLATVDYGLGHLERFLEFILRPSSNGLLYEQCSLREVLQDLELDIPGLDEWTGKMLQFLGFYFFS